MAWGARGKNHNVGLLEPGRLRAKDWQYEVLKKLDRRKHKGLTYEEAAQKIKEAYDRRAAERAGLTSTEEHYIEALWRKAIKVANDAGERWLAQNPKVLFVVNEEGNQIGVHGTIGRAWLSWPSFSIADLMAEMSVPASAVLASAIAPSTWVKVSSETFDPPSASRCSLTNFSVW